MSNEVGEAQQAVQQKDWAALAQSLQTILLTETGSGLSSADRQALVSYAIAGLESGDFQTRWDIAKLFPRLGEGAIAPLVVLLQTDAADQEARWFAARILGDLNHPTAIRALVACLQDTDDEDLSEMAAIALANLGETAIAALAALLDDPDTRGLAVHSLSQIRRAATISPLLGVVDDPQPDIRTLALEALSSFHDPRIPPVLLNALQDPAVTVRRAAVVGLGVRTDLVVELNLISVMSDRLWDPDPGICQQAALALGRLGAESRDEAAVTLLLQAVRSPHAPESLQLEIIRALGWVGTQPALAALQQLLGDRQSDRAASRRQTEIITAIGRWTDPDLHPAAAQILIDQLHAPAASLPHRTAIALALGQLQQSIALEPLIALLAEDDASLRLHIIAALKQIDWEAAKQRLESLQASPTLPPAAQQGIAIALQEWQLELPR